MIDKAHAFNRQTLGEYIFPCPLDNITLDFLGVSAEEFTQLAEKNDDPDISRWIEEKSQRHDPEKKEWINGKILEGKPDTQEKKEKFLKIRDTIDPSRTEIKTWVDSIDLEEGRL